MKYFVTVLFLSALLWGGPTPSAHAQMMGVWNWNEQITAEEKARINAKEDEGKAVYEQLQAKTLTCDQLTESQFVLLGEYFMGLIHGDSHPLMNKYLIAMHGVEAMHALHYDMGKVQGGCATDVMQTLPLPRFGMGGGMFNGGTAQPRTSTTWNQHMTGWTALSFTWWAMIIAGLGALAYALINQRADRRAPQNAHKILDERFAKGELTATEYEKMKTELKK